MKRDHKNKRKPKPLVTCVLGLLAEILLLPALWIPYVGGAHLDPMAKGNCFLFLGFSVLLGLICVLRILRAKKSA